LVISPMSAISASAASAAKHAIPTAMALMTRVRCRLPSSWRGTRMDSSVGPSDGAIGRPSVVEAREVSRSVTEGANWQDRRPWEQRTLMFDAGARSSLKSLRFRRFGPILQP